MSLSGPGPVTLPILNNKGGIGKTTTAVNLAAALSRAGVTVLLVDLDSQASASLSLGLERPALSPSVADVLFADAPIEDGIRALPHEPFDLLPASMDLASADVKLFEAADRHRRLRRCLQAVQSLYEIILLDCPPSTSLLTLNAMMAGDALLIPVSPAYLALEGIVQLGDVITQVRSSLDETAPVLGLLLTMVDRNREHEEQVIAQVRAHYGDQVFSTEIDTDDALSAAAERGRSVFEHAPASRGAEAHAALADEVLARIEQAREASSSASAA
jgi:chromosome partitioning protein